jgi:pyruvate dehydrogenase E1 component
MEHRIRSINRWNAAALVLRAGKKDLELGGHIASFQSSATLYDVGFNHFWRAPNDEQDGDLIYFQGHIARACIPAPSWKAACPKSSWTASVRKWTATACPPIRTRG